jgi:acyl dehydratase
MYISSDIVGFRTRPIEAEIDWRQTTNHAAALEDANPLFLDDRRPEGLVAHPMFAAVFSWPLVATLEEHLGELPYPPVIWQTKVHHAQHLRIDRLVRPGDRLRGAGEVIAVLPHRAGARVVLELRVTDQRGAPVHVETIGALLRDVRCQGEGVGAERLPGHPELPDMDAPTWDERLDIPATAAHVYDGCTDIVFPIHTSAAFAEAVGLPGMIYQGSAMLARAVSCLVEREAQGDATRVTDLDARFGAFVRPGAHVQVRLLARARDDAGTHLWFDVRNHDGEPAVRGGYMRLRG